MLQRVIAAKDNSTMTKGIFIGMVFMILLSGSCATLGFVGRTLWGWEMNTSLLLLANATVLPTFIGGAFLAACTAFIVTSGNSYLLSAGNSLVYDLIVPLSGRTFTDKQLVWMNRWTIPIIGLVGFITSLWFPLGFGGAALRVHTLRCHTDASVICSLSVAEGNAHWRHCLHAYRIDCHSRKRDCEKAVRPRELDHRHSSLDRRSNRRVAHDAGHEKRRSGRGGE